MIDKPTSSQSTLRALVPAALVAGLTLFVGTATLYAAPARGEMAVVFPPWVDATTAYRSILVAGGQFVANSRFDNIAVAYAPDETFKDRVTAAGALFLLAANGICGPVPPKSSQEPP